MSRPVLLDLFCGAGGATKGYQTAGFHVVGVDIDPQPSYCGDEFIRGDVLELGPALLASGRFVATGASPPCQGYSRMNHVHKRTYPMLIPQTRAMLIASGMPYVIENVEGAPLLDPIMPCGQMFGLGVIRHRMFESNVSIAVPEHTLPHPRGLYSPTGHGDPNWRKREQNPHLSGVGYTDRVRHAMGIDRMNRDMMAEAIPPAYTEFIGAQVLASLERAT